jgi:hypothetical protein
MSNRSLGDLDAEHDLRLPQLFIKVEEMQGIYTNRSSIIYGVKGSGKTAIRLALTKFLSNIYYAAVGVDLKDLSFVHIHAALRKLHDSGGGENEAVLARHTWLNVLTLYGLDALCAALPNSEGLRARIESILVDEGFHQVKSDSTKSLLQHIIRLLEKVAKITSDEWGYESDAANEVKRSLETREITSQFPSHPEILSVLESASNILGDGKRVLVCLDGFDSILTNHSQESRSKITPESRTAIFAGLIDAVYTCATDERLSRVFCFKAFLPQELTKEAHQMVWDHDKHYDKTFHLQWSVGEIQQFLHQRLQTLSRSKAKEFNQVWAEFMPTQIRNEVHGVDEATFDYILRHTLYRPRQVMWHVQTILNQWDTINSSPRVDPSFIKPIVAQTNKELAKSTVAQLEFDYPLLESFLRSFGGQPNVIPAEQFLKRVTKIFNCDAANEPDIVEALFKFGLFGTAKEGRVQPGSPRSEFQFGFVGDPTTYSALDSNDLIAVSPMFHEYCRCIHSNYGVITPV